MIKFRKDEFWKAIPLWKGVEYSTFVDHTWQEKNAITNHKKLLKTIQDLVSDDFLEDAFESFMAALYLDNSYDTCKVFIRNLLVRNWINDSILC